jgi:hypothetical protein
MHTMQARLQVKALKADNQGHPAQLTVTSIVLKHLEALSIIKHH